MAGLTPIAQLGALAGAPFCFAVAPGLASVPAPSHHSTPEGSNMAAAKKSIPVDDNCPLKGADHLAVVGLGGGSGQLKSHLADNHRSFRSKRHNGRMAEMIRGLGGFL